MYEKFFGLRERPFELTPNPKFLYLTGKHREAFGNLRYGIEGRKGITLLVGEAGTGKTTLVRAAIEAVSGPSVRCVYVSNPVLTRAEFYEFLAPRLGLSERAAGSKAQFLSELEDHLLARHKAGRTTALIVDEAQSLPQELMEEVRLLANFETADEKLLQVVLAGQPELADRLEHEELRQLKQRVALRCDLLPLDVRQTAAYVSGRVAIAGGQAVRIFTREAILAIHHYSRGIPRTISVICDNAMVNAFATGVVPIEAAVIDEVGRDFRLSPDRQVPVDPTGAAPDGPQSQVMQQAAASEPGNGNHFPRNVAAPKTAAPRVDQRPARGGGSGRTPNASPPPTAAKRKPAALQVVKKTTTDEIEPSQPATPDGGKQGLDTLFALFTKRNRFRFF